VLNAEMLPDRINIELKKILYKILVLGVGEISGILIIILIRMEKLLLEI
jgi:hypothetical protein